MLHRILTALRLRSEFDYAPPALGPEVPHPYVQRTSVKCCEHCGGGQKHAIHKPPFDARRTAEVLASVTDEALAAMIQNHNEKALAAAGAANIAGTAILLIGVGVEWMVKNTWRRLRGALWTRS